MPSEPDDIVAPDEDLSPELPPANIEVFELDESSSESVTPDMEPQILFIKLKEAQYKNTVAEAEVAKLKAKMIRLENAETQKKVLEKKCEDSAKRLRELENKLHQSQKEVSQYQDLMEGSQGQYINLEKKMQFQYGALKKKYYNAKKAKFSTLPIQVFSTYSVEEYDRRSDEIYCPDGYSFLLSTLGSHTRILGE